MCSVMDWQTAQAAMGLEMVTFFLSIGTFTNTTGLKENGLVYVAAGPVKWCDHANERPLSLSLLGGIFSIPGIWPLFHLNGRIKCSSTKLSTELWIHFVIPWPLPRDKNRAEPCRILTLRATHPDSAPFLTATQSTESPSLSHAPPKTTSFVK